MAHFTSTIWSGQWSRGPQPVVEADHDEPAGGQRGADAVDDEAARVVVPRDPGAAVDVDGGGCRPVQDGGLGDPGLLVVAVADVTCGPPTGPGSTPRGESRPARSGGAGGPARAGQAAGDAEQQSERARAQPLRMALNVGRSGPGRGPDPPETGRVWRRI